MRVARTFEVSRLTLGLVVGAVVALCAGSAVAGEYLPTAIRGDKVSVMAKPSSTAIFGCELAPFDGSEGLWCYGPDAIRKAYGVYELIADGNDGKGQTIVIIDAFGSPTVE